MNALPSFFVPERAVGVDRTVQFNLAGDKGGEWSVHIHDGNLDVLNGQGDHPDLVLTAEVQDLLDIFAGKLDPMKAYMRGRVRLQGSMSLAMKLARYFDVDMQKLRSIGS